ncbi:MAG: hypothetical protein ACE5F1_17865 [Planctomycetota bacterium]
MSRTPKSILFCLPLLLASTLPAQAQKKATALGRSFQSTPPSQEELIARRDQKLAEPFFEHADWITDYDKARAAARRERKLIFTYFSRSYAP